MHSMLVKNWHSQAVPSLKPLLVHCFDQLGGKNYQKKGGLIVSIGLEARNKTVTIRIITYI